MSQISLNSISFPVFRVGYNEPISEEGVLYLAHKLKYVDKDDEEVVRIVDNKNIPGNSLATRRLALRAAGANLHKLSKAIFFIGDLIKIAKSNLWFIDMDGQVFQYRKTTRVPLKFKPISKIIPMAHGGAIIEVKGIPSRFKTLFLPDVEQKYAGLLQIKDSYILYGLYDQLYDDTTRMI